MTTLQQPFRTPGAGATITAVMPACDCRSFLQQTLPPLLVMRSRGDLQEVIVVDDGSLDDTASVATAMGARVVSSGGRRRGPGAARNEAARVARGDILWFVDADVIAAPDGPAQIRLALADPRTVAVFGSYDDAPAAPNLLSQYKNLVHHHYHQTGRREASTFWAGCGAVRRDAFLAVGGFDVARFPQPSIEDIELGYRLRAAGGRIVLRPELQGKHLKVWRLGNLVRTEILQRALPWSRLLLAGEGQGGDLNVGRAEKLRALIACAAAAAILAALVGLAPWWLPLAILAGAVAANRALLSLFVRRSGLGLGLFGLLFHQLYYLYSTAAYAWCWVESKRARRSSPAPLRAAKS